MASLIMDDLNGLMKRVFDNTMILKLVLDNFEIKNSDDLKNCRLVCSKWNELATRILQKINWASRKFLLFSNNDQIGKYVETFANNRENVMFYCFDFKNEPRGRGMNFMAYFSMDILNVFFRVFPQSIRSLKLSYLRLEGAMDLDSILRSQSNSLIELEVNSIFDSVAYENASPKKPEQGHDGTTVDFYLTSLKYLRAVLDIDDFVHKYHFESICRRIPPENRDRSKFEICLIRRYSETNDTIDTLIKYNEIKCLKSLHVRSAMNGNAKYFDEAGIELEFLDLDFHSFSTHFLGEQGQEIEQPHIAEGLDSRTYEMCEFVRRQHKTLKALSWTNKMFRFPPWGMPELKKLRLELQITFAWFSSDDENEPGHLPILYGETFPKLDELVLCTDFDNAVSRLHFTTMFLSPQVSSCPGLQKLNIHYAKLNAEMLTTISTTFPKIKFLEIGISRDEFDQVNEQNFYSVLWNAEFGSTIQELIIETDGGAAYGIEFGLDSLYSGVDMQEIQKIVGAQSYENINEGHDSILNFKNLKRLELRTCSFDSIFYDAFGDFSAYCVFGRMKCLKFLHVDDKLAQFSDLAIEALREKARDPEQLAEDQTLIEKKHTFETDFESYCKSKQGQEWEGGRKYYNLLD